MLRSGVEQDADVDVPYIVMEYVDGVQNVADWAFRERLGARLRDTLLSMGNGVLTRLFGDLANPQSAEQILECTVIMQTLIAVNIISVFSKFYLLSIEAD